MKAATPAATLGYANRFTSGGFTPDAYRILGRTELTVSAIGFGGYRVDDVRPEHAAALGQALRRGCNLIDTSTNYTDGRSESCIGKVLADLFEEKTLRREEVVVVSKIGYVQGQNLDLARQRVKEGAAFEDMVKISPGCWHCIHPGFLEDQLGRSLARLGLERLDVCLLHNPEYFLEETHRKGELLDSAREEFYNRIRQAFVHLEQEVRRGRLTWYGVSSNSFGSAPEQPDATSLGRMLEMAREAAEEVGFRPEDHHFAVAQLPMNLYEHSPVTTRKEGVGGHLSAVALASENGIGVLVNRPLNAFAHGQLVRLADFHADSPEVSIRRGLEKVSEIEQEFREEHLPHIQSSPETGGPPLDEAFTWGLQLQSAAGRLGGYEHWQQIQEQLIYPHLRQGIALMRDRLSSDEERKEKFDRWLERYLPMLERLLNAIRADCVQRSQRRSDKITALVNPALPYKLRTESLSRKALHAVASVEGVASVLNGMRRPQYVEDSMGILAWPRLENPDSIFSEF